MDIIVVRHASTKYNEQGLINGRHDDTLSVRGQKELPGLLKRLKGYEIELVYSSPLKRAVDTARPISEAKKAPLKLDNRLMEVDFGTFTSKNWDSMKEIFGMPSRELLDTYSYDLRPYGGESSDQVRKRIEDFLADLAKTDQKALIVTHGGIIRWFYYLLNHQKTTALPNSSIQIFQL